MASLFEGLKVRPLASAHWPAKARQAVIELCRAPRSWPRARAQAWAWTGCWSMDCKSCPMTRFHSSTERTPPGGYHRLRLCSSWHHSMCLQLPVGTREMKWGLEHLPLLPHHGGHSKWHHGLPNQRHHKYQGRHQGQTPPWKQIPRFLTPAHAERIVSFSNHKFCY